MRNFINENGIVLCIPYGGLNDVLCQVKKCLDYSVKYKRTLFLDTRFSGILLEFSQLFKFKSSFDINIVETTTAKDYVYLNSLKTKPLQCEGRVDLKPHWPKNSSNYCVYGTDSLFTFDFNVSHCEQLLVHSQCGGGAGSQVLLHDLSLSEECQKIIKNSILSLPKEYISIHVRNTDLQSDYVTFFKGIYDETINKNIFIASDSEEVIIFAKNFFKKSIIYYNQNIRYLQGKRLHSHDIYFNDNEKFQSAVNALKDLILLASSNKIFYTSTTKGVISGYSALASYLHANKILINALLE